MPAFEWHSSPRTTEKQDVAIAVLELEPTQPVMSVLEWFRKLDIARRKFGRQRIRIRNVKVSVPTCRWLSLVVREWIYTDALEHDHRATPAHDAKEWIVSGLLKGDLKSKLVAIKRECCRGVMHDEEG